MDLNTAQLWTLETKRSVASVPMLRPRGSNQHKLVVKEKGSQLNFVGTPALASLAIGSAIEGQTSCDSVFITTKPVRPIVQSQF